MHKTVFEKDPRLCLNVFKNAKIREIAKQLIGMSGTGRGSIDDDRCLTIHVMHNNAFCVKPGMRGQAAVWHQDDAPLFCTADGKPLPESVIVSPMVITCMYYLNDVRGEVDGMTQVIPGSHRFGIPCSPSVASTYEYVAPAVTKGTALLISSSVWHKGAPVLPEGNPRYVFQVSYGRRLVGHKHDTIMNYMMPRSVMDFLPTEEDKELMGFLQGGAYS